MRKFISLVTAVCLAAGTMMSAVPVSAVSVKGDANGDGTITLNDFICVKKYLLNVSDKIDTEASDMNSDGITNIIDLISLLSLFDGDNEISDENLNEAAKRLYTEIQRKLDDLISDGTNISDGEYNGEDEMFSGLKTSGYLFDAVIKKGRVKKVVCRSNSEEGSYPFVPAEGWTMKKLAEATTLSGKRLDYPLSLDMLGDEFQFDMSTLRPNGTGSQIDVVKDGKNVISLIYDCPESDVSRSTEVLRTVFTAKECFEINGFRLDGEYDDLVYHLGEPHNDGGVFLTKDGHIFQAWRNSKNGILACGLDFRDFTDWLE